MTKLRLAVVPPILAVCLILAAFLFVDLALAQQPAVFHGNVQSHIYHRQGCRYFDCKACTAVFKAKEEAAKAGYKLCKTTVTF